MRLSKLMAIAPAVVCAFVLNACGGGGGNGSSSSTGGTGTTGAGQQTSTGLSYSLSQKSVAVQGDTSSSKGIVVTIDWTISNWPASSDKVIYDLVSVDGVPVGATNSDFLTFDNGPTKAGRVTLNLYSPDVLGAGTFHGSVTLSMCYINDPNLCTGDQLAGPRSTIPLTYTITGAAKSTVQFTLPAALGLAVEARSDDSAGPTAQLDLFEAPNSYLPLYASGSESGVPLVQAITKSSQDSGLARIGVSFKPPAEVGAGIHHSTLTLKICVDPQCAHELANSPAQVPVTYTVTATQNKDYQYRFQPLVSADIRASVTRHLIYAVTAPESPLDPSSIVAIDPVSGSIGSVLALAGSPATMGDDDAYAYVGFSDLNAVQRVALATLTSDALISLGTDATYGSRYAGYIEVQPGHSHTIAVAEYLVSQSLGDWSSAGVVIFDDQTPRPSPFAATNGHRAPAMAWNTDGSTLYVNDSGTATLFALTPASGGLTQASALTNVQIGGDITVVNGSLYGTRGLVVDLSSGMQRTLAGCEGLPTPTIDPAGLRAFFVFQDSTGPSSAETLESYDIQTQTPLSKARVGSVSPPFIAGPRQGSMRLIRWGSDGVAINTQRGVEIFEGQMFQGGP